MTYRSLADLIVIFALDPLNVNKSAKLLTVCLPPHVIAALSFRKKWTTTQQNNMKELSDGNIFNFVLYVDVFSAKALCFSKC